MISVAVHFFKLDVNIDDVQTRLTLGSSRKLKVKKQLLHGYFPMRLVQMSLESRILWFYIKVKPFQDHDEVLTIIAIYWLKIEIMSI